MIVFNCRNIATSIALYWNTIQYTLYTIQYTLYSIHCTLYSIHYTIYTIHYTVYTVHYILYSIFYTVYSIHYTVYTIQSIINNLRGKNQTSSSFCIKEGNSVITDEKVIANKFNKHFCSLADNLNKGIRKPHACNFRDYLSPSQASPIFLKKTTTTAIISIIEEFENDKPSDIPIIVIKHCATTIAPTLSSLFNKYIESGELPPVLKIGRISPIYKKDAKDNVKNYRPVSTLPIFGKIFEKVPYSRIYD